MTSLVDLLLGIEKFKRKITKEHGLDKILHPRETGFVSYYKNQPTLIKKEDVIYQLEESDVEELQNIIGELEEVHIGRKSPFYPFAKSLVPVSVGVFKKRTNPYTGEPEYFISIEEASGENIKELFGIVNKIEFPICIEIKTKDGIKIYESGDEKSFSIVYSINKKRNYSPIYNYTLLLEGKVEGNNLSLENSLLTFLSPKEVPIKPHILEEYIEKDNEALGHWLEGDKDLAEKQAIHHIEQDIMKNVSPHLEEIIKYNIRNVNSNIPFKYMLSFDGEEGRIECRAIYRTHLSKGMEELKKLEKVGYNYEHLKRDLNLITQRLLDCGEEILRFVEDEVRKYVI